MRMVGAETPVTFPVHSPKERERKKESRVRLLWRVCYFSRILVNGTEFTVDGSREGKLTAKTITTLPCCCVPRADDENDALPLPNHSSD